MLWNCCFNGEVGTRRQLEGDSLSVEHQTGKVLLHRLVSVERIADNGMAEIGEMDANLVTAARARMGLDKGGGVIVFVCMGLLPPWYHTRETWTPYRYSFLWDPPVIGYHYNGEWRERDQPDACFQLDTRRLYVQWIMVAVVTTGLVVIFHGKQEKP